jgi:hypothetical protein
LEARGWEQKRGGKRGVRKGRGQGEGGVMTQLLYVHMNKGNKTINK